MTQIEKGNGSTHLTKVTPEWQNGLSYLTFIFVAVILLFPLDSSAGIRLDIQSFPLNAKLAKKGFDAPLNSLIPNIDGMRIKWARYKRYKTHTFRIHKHKLNAEGKYWKLDYGSHGGSSLNTKEVLGVYRALLEQHSANINMGRNGQSFLFAVTTPEHQYNGKFSAYKNSVSLEMIEADAFKQTLKISPDTLRAELLSSGKVTLEGVYFDFDKATLQARSQLAIQAAVVLLRKYPDLELEVQGHTDAKGSEEYNLKLSQQRAASVVKAITQQGIAAKRLKSQGYGQSQPVASNEDEAGRAKNRRVELHRIRGGEKRALLDVNFIKPIPGSVETWRNHYDQNETTIFYREPYAKQRAQVKIMGNVERIRWEFQHNGKRDRSVAPEEIIKNYLGVLELFGVEITSGPRSGSNKIHFRIPDRGDGREAYGVISAFTGGYELKYILPEAPSNPPATAAAQHTPVKAAPEPSVQRPAQHQDTPEAVTKPSISPVAPQPAVSTSPEGKWYFDEAATRAGTSPDRDLTQYAGSNFEFAPDGTFRTLGIDAGQWKLEKGAILVEVKTGVWKDSRMKMENGHLVGQDGNLQLVFTHQAPSNKVTTASPKPPAAAATTASAPWTLDGVLSHLTKVNKLQYHYENIHNIQDTRTWHLKFDGKQLLSRLYSKNQNGGEFIDSDWVYFNAKAGDAANGPLLSNGSRSRKPMQFAAAPKTSVPAGTFNCTKVYTKDRFGDPVEAWLIDAMPGVPAKIVTKKATYQLERIIP